jgi:hypothetical protein
VAIRFVATVWICSNDGGVLFGCRYRQGQGSRLHGSGILLHCTAGAVLGALRAAGAEGASSKQGQQAGTKTGLGTWATTPIGLLACG